MEKLDVSIDDPLLEQSVYQECFEIILREYFENCTRKCGSISKPSIDSISSYELNVLRYACGYVAQKLLKCYEKKPGDTAEQYVACLGEMAVQGEGDDFLSYTKQWMELVNRGGLFPLNDDAFRLFIEIELCVHIFLPEHMLRTQSDKDTFLQNVHDKISLDEDVQFYWTLLSQELLEDTETLLKEIIKLWVTV